jgi:hypothetical protein
MLMNVVLSEWVITDTSGVYDYSGNPILTPPDKHEWLLGDPTIISLGNEIHMFANEVFHGIIHLVANKENPTEFTKVDGIVNLPGSVRPYAFISEPENKLFLFYEQYEFPLYKSSKILLRTASINIIDGHASFDWQKELTEILEPELDWEKIGTVRVGNPFVFYNNQKLQYWMYYSASSVHLDDSNVDEPISIGLASSASLYGPWTRIAQSPLLITGGTPDTINLGIGSLKLIKGLTGEDQDTNYTVLMALANRITLNTTNNVTGSTISYMTSLDGGYSWSASIPNFIAPSLSNPPTWKQAYCYGFDTIADPTDSSYVLAYYNGRNGWMHANESIGVSRIDKNLF